MTVVFARTMSKKQCIHKQCKPATHTTTSKSSAMARLLHSAPSMVTAKRNALIVSFLVIPLFLFIDVLVQFRGSDSSRTRHGVDDGRQLSNPDNALLSQVSKEEEDSPRDTKMLNERNILGNFSTSSSDDDLSSLRIVAFGSSRTWGAGLPDRHHQAYLWQVSQSATNLAIRATGPDIPALCAYTMLGDEKVYDVIIFEFVPRSHQENVWLDRFALRMRARFPHAVFIFIRFHLLSGYRHASGVSAFDWFTKERQIRSLWDKTAMERELMEHTRPSDWTYTPDNPQEKRHAVQDRIISSVNGILLEFPSRRHQLVDPRQDFLAHAQLYGERDWNHPSVKGHRRLAGEVRDILTNLALAKNSLFEKNRNTVGPWLGGHDRCDNWFSQQTEIPSWTDGKATLKHGPGMIMNAFFRRSTSQKSALEVSSNGGYVEVVNDIGGPAELYLSHMTVGPAPNPMYPTTHVTIDDIPDISVDIVPEMSSNTNIHVQVTAFICTIPPGKHNLRLLPLEEKEQPFRVTGIIVSPPKDVLTDAKQQQL